MEKIVKLFVLILLIPGLAWAEGKAVEPTSEAVKAGSAAETHSQPKLTYAKPMETSQYFDPLEYTLGPEDVIEITVLRHPEFSGIFPINSEGKIQYKFVGDIDVTGLTKRELEEKVAEVVSRFVIKPETDVTILEYKSKVIYVIGEVARPGKYYMRSDTIPVREAAVQAGLPTLTAAMRKCRLITPSEDGKAKIKYIDLYSLLYGGDLSINIDMHPGEILYVPSTVMAKVMRVIRPVAEPVAGASSIGSAVTGF